MYVIQSSSHVWLSVTPWTTACQASLSLTISWSLPKFMSIELVMPPTILSSVTLFSFCLQSFPASGVFPVSWPFASGSQSIGASASASHGKPNVASNHQKLKETKKDSLLETLGEAWTCWQLISDFWNIGNETYICGWSPPLSLEMVLRIKFLLF